MVKDEREKYFANLARGLASNPGPIDQREIDYKRGFWAGAIWALQALPKRKTAEWDAYIAAAAEEGESPE